VGKRWRKVEKERIKWSATRVHAVVIDKNGKVRCRV
jgi:hypothetical protein